MTEPSPLWRRSWPIIAIVALTVLCYLPILRAGFIWDDSKHVTQNSLLHSVGGLETLWTDRTALPQYYPLTHTFFWLEYHLWGNDPLGYHAVNVILHALNSVLVWRIFIRLRIPGALLAGLIFAVHPMQVETVGWVSERKNTLSALFYLSSLLIYFRLSPFSDEGRGKFRWYLAALGLFICSLLCKTVTSTMPAVVLLLIWWKCGRIHWKDVRPLLPFFVLGIIAGLNTASLERTHVGAVGPDWIHAPTLGGEVVARALIAGRVAWFYLAKELLPYPLMFEYPRWHIDVHASWQYLFPILLLVFILSLILLSKRIGRSPAVAVLFFVGTLVPALGFTNIYPTRFSFVADHFQYLAILGPIAIGSAVIVRLLPAPRIALAAVILCSFGMLTFSRASTFRSAESLYADSIAKNPNGWMTQSNLGALLIGDHQLDDAQNHLLKALSLHPDNAIAAIRMGQIATDRNEYGVAIAWDRSAAQLNPKMAEPHFAMAENLVKAGDTDGAVDEYTEAITLEPNNLDYRVALGSLLSRLHRYADAVVQFDEAVRIDPQSQVARIDRIAALERAGDYDRAATELRSLLAKKPDAMLYRDLGIVEALRHRPIDAVTAFSNSLRLKPDQPDVRGRLEDAIRQAEPH